MPNCCTEPAPAPTHAIIKCAGCGEAGRPVSTRTLKHMVRPQFLERISKPGFLFCASPRCEVVYFHPDGDQLFKGDLRMHVGIKETEDSARLCYCFGFTRGMVANEVRATGQCTIPQRITAEMRAGNCAC